MNEIGARLPERQGTPLGTDGPPAVNTSHLVLSSLSASSSARDWERPLSIIARGETANRFDEALNALMLFAKGPPRGRGRDDSCGQVVSILSATKPATMPRGSSLVFGPVTSEQPIEREKVGGDLLHRSIDSVKGNFWRRL